ncbi:MAG: hypothetical protein JXA13_16885 [Anaerolineales bacterium]|nr:hypothetical protein [Anaerolineales bacterium]
MTPESSRLVAFNTERQLLNYLEQQIQPDGSCRLWIKPGNQLQTIFHKKRWRL